MREEINSRAVGRSCAVFRRMLVIYPREHREEYGKAMEQLFRDQYRDASNERAIMALIRFWLLALVDLVKTAVMEHLSNLNRRKSMLSDFRPRFKPLSVFLPIFAGAFLLAIISSMVIVFLLPNIFASTARVVVEEFPTASSGSVENPYFLQTEFEVIQSNPVLDKVIQRLNLCEVWGKKYAHGRRLEISKAEALLKRNLELSPVRNTKLVEIQAFSEDPREAALLANGVAEAYRDFSDEVSNTRNKNSGTTQTKVTLIDPAIPGQLPVRPNRPLMIFLGMIVGILLGFVAGGVGAGLFGSAPEKSNLATDTNLMTSKSGSGTTLAVWLVGSLWMSIGIAVTILCIIFLFQMILTGEFDVTLVVLFFCLLGGLTCFAGFSVIQGRLLAKIYLILCGAVLALGSALADLFPLPQALRWYCVAFGIITVCSLLVPQKQPGSVPPEIRRP